MLFRSYATVFVDDYSNYSWIYGHQSTADVLPIFQRFLADTSSLQEKHGRVLTVRRDNSSVNVSRAMMTFLDQKQIRSETSNPYEPWQNGKAERMLQTLMGTARTNMVFSGLDGRWWLHALQYAVHVRSRQYSPATKSSAFILMLGDQPDVSYDQAFGVEGWIHLRPDQRSDPKFGARGEHCILVG